MIFPVNAFLEYEMAAWGVLKFRDMCHSYDNLK